MLLSTLLTLPFSVLLLSDAAPLGLFYSFLTVAGVVALGLVPWLVYRNRRNKRNMGIILLGLVMLLGLSVGNYTPFFLLGFVALPAIGIGWLLFRKPSSSGSQHPDSTK